MALVRRTAWLQVVEGAACAARFPVRAEGRRNHFLPKRGLFGVVLGACLVTACWAAPSLPSDGSVVLERLRERPFDTASRELRALRQSLARDPTNLALATRVAQRYIEEARQQGDPRFVGYAQAAIGPWWSLPRPPNAVLVLRATIRQSSHDFDAALADLAQVVKSEPGNAQAWLTRATILQVKGDYGEAAQSCQQLSRLAPAYITASCLAGVASMTGQAEAGYQLLLRTLEKNPAASDAERVWVETGLAEIATRLDRRVAAEGHFTRALRINASDPYLKGAYADFLLDAGRAREVVRLLSADARIDGLLLRLALAEQAMGAAELPGRTASLRARFDAARARGDRVHQREEARFQTYLLKQPREGLKLAQSNWVVQKEPADARVLLEAALAADEPKAAQPVIDWMNRNNVEDAALARIAQRLRRPG